MKNYTVDILRKENLIIFEGISGSRAYGTNMPNSDTDLRGVFIQPIEDILGNDYIPQVADKTNDIVFYEIRRFLELVETNNPNILELLAIPEDCVVYKDSIFDLVLNNKHKFLSKLCKQTFSGYAMTQIKKAQGLNKMINWEHDKVTRKTVLDFCYVLSKNGKTIKFNSWIEQFNNQIGFWGPYDQKYFGLSKINNARDVYGLYDVSKEKTWDGKSYYGGIYKTKNSNDIKLTSFSKDAQFIAYLVFNKDSYSTHCKDYKSYQTWVKNRNPERYKTNIDHGKGYDSKNLMHCVRLLTMSHEIADGDIIVRRPPEDIKMLMTIRKGELEFDDLIKKSNVLIERLDEAYTTSTLPDKVDSDFIDELLTSIRRLRYKLTKKI